MPGAERSREWGVSGCLRGIASGLHNENNSGGWLHNKMNVHLKMVKMVKFHFLYILPHTQKRL